MELRAFDDDAAAAWFERLLDATPGLEEEQRVPLREIHGRLRDHLRDVPLDAAGIVLTVRPDTPGVSLEEALETRMPVAMDDLTVWLFTFLEMVVPGSPEIDPVAVLERWLSSDVGELQPGEEIEPFHTEDGRSGLALHTTLARRAAAAPLPDSGGDEGGHVVAALHLGPGLPDGTSRLLIGTGSCVRRSERDGLALSLALQMVGTRVLGPDDDLPGAPLVSTVPVDEDVAS